MTSRGEVVVYEVGSGTDESALTQIAQRDAEPGELIARFGLIHEGARLGGRSEAQQTCRTAHK